MWLQPYLPSGYSSGSTMVRLYTTECDNTVTLLACISQQELQFTDLQCNDARDQWLQAVSACCRSSTVQNFMQYNEVPKVNNHHQTKAMAPQLFIIYLKLPLMEAPLRSSRIDKHLKLVRNTRSHRWIGVGN